MKASFLCFSLLLLVVFFQPVQANDEAAGKKYAIIIAVSKYDDPKNPSLPFTFHDACFLATTLNLRGGYEVLPLYEKVNASPSITSPTRENITRFVEDALARCTPKDTVLLYFSGHGIADKNDSNKTYLLPRDNQAADRIGTALPTAWLRDELTKCQAGTKFLFIDACHAGGEKSADDPSVSLSSQELAGPEMEGVVTIASCTKDQRSYLWPEKGISLFSYWLVEGLKGHADKDGDGSVTIDELHEFLHRSVSKTAVDVIGQKQTPVRIVKSDVMGVPSVIRPKPITLDSLLDDMAENIATEMGIWEVKKTGILEFMIQTPTGLVLDRNKYGLLPTYCAEQLEMRIRDRLPKKREYSVVAREAVRSALKERGISVDDLFSDKVAGQPLNIGNDTLESFIVGVLQHQQGAEVRLQCKLLDVNGMNTLAMAGGRATLTESEWAMLGRSFETPAPTMNTQTAPKIAPKKPIEVVDTTKIVTTPASFRVANELGNPNRRRVSTNVPDLPKSTVVDTGFVEELEKKSEPHPLQRRDRNFDVRIEVKDSAGRFQARPVQMVKGKMYVPLKSGDVFRLIFQNKYPYEVGARVLIDGLNTLPERQKITTAKFAIDTDDDSGESEAENVVPEEHAFVIAPVVNLDRARFWIFKPGASRISGFFSSTGVAAEGREFRVVDADQSEAAQKEFTEQIGIITVAVYTIREQAETRGSRRRSNVSPLGTELGDSFTTEVKERPNMEVDRLLQVIHLYYPAP